MKTRIEILLVTLIIGGLTAIYSCSDDPEEPLSSEKEILSFNAPGQTGSATINETNMTVEAEVECDTDLTNLAPTFTISDEATAAPASGTASDYSNQVTITVTAEDGSTADWKVTISKTCSNEADILTFTLTEQTGEADIDNVGNNIEIEVAAGTDVSSLTPAWTLSEGATSDPLSGTTGDYSDIYTITVTAENGDEQEWEIDVSVADDDLSSENDILTFTLTEQTGEADIDNLFNNIEIEVANGTDLTSLTPAWTLSEGATSDPVSGTTSDYSSTFTITVTAENGDEQDWEVEVTEAE